MPVDKGQTQLKKGRLFSLAALALLAVLALTLPSFSLESLYSRAVREQLLPDIKRRPSLSLDLSGVQNLTKSEKGSLARGLADSLHAELCLSGGDASPGTLRILLSDAPEENGAVLFTVSIDCGPLNARSVRCRGRNLFGMWFYQPVEEMTA